MNYNDRTTMSCKIYVASSWRNNLHERVVEWLLNNTTNYVFDYRQQYEAFRWVDIDPNWENWTIEQYKEALDNPIAVDGFEKDMSGLRMCDLCLLLLPSGLSASWEFGWALGAGKKGVIFSIESFRPELMYSGNEILTTWNEFYEFFGG